MVFTVYDAKESPKDSVALLETAEQIPRMCGERESTGDIAIGAIRIEKEMYRRLSEDDYLKSRPVCRTPRG